MRSERVLAIARLEAGEIVRDPQIGFLLAGTVALLHVVLLSAQRLSPTSALAVIVGVGPLVLLFLAGPRRGAAHEGAFRRVVLACPIEPVEWFLGRALGMQSLTIAYAALMLPALLLELSISRAPGPATLNALTALAAFALVLTLAGLAFSTLSTARGAGMLTLVALGLLASYRLVAGLRVFPDAALRRAYAFVLALAPPVMVGVAAGFTGPGDVPSWAIAIALAAAIFVTGSWSASRHGVRAPPAWALVAALCAAGLAVALSVSFDASAPGPAEPADVIDDGGARVDLLAPLALVALVPLSVALLRRRMRTS